MELRRTQERYRRLLDTALEGVWSIDAGAHTTYVNEQMAWMLGHTVEEMAGRSFYDFIDEAARDEAMRSLERRTVGVRDRRDRDDFRFRRKDGSLLWAIVSVIPIVDDDGTFEGVLALVTDITDRKRAERAEQRAETLRSVASLANAAAHEINNPLTVIVGTLQLLDRNTGLDGLSHVRIQRALLAARDIHAILGRMSRITRLEESGQSSDLPIMLDLHRSSPEDSGPLEP
jgi:PAS domain S-box-containing protein